jgi:heme-degrading monooxygenase HmoA
MFSRYLDYAHNGIIPAYESAAGLISVAVFQRPVVGYVELLTLTMWQSEQALTRFLEDSLTTSKDRSDYGVIYMEPPMDLFRFRPKSDKNTTAGANRGNCRRLNQPGQKPT